MPTAADQMILKKASRFPLVVDKARESVMEELSLAELKTIVLRLVRFVNVAQIAELMSLRCSYLEVVDSLGADSSLLREETNLMMHGFLLPHFPSAIFRDKRERIAYLDVFRRLRAFIGRITETVDPELSDELRQGLAQTLSRYLDHLLNRLGLRIVSAGTEPRLWDEGIIFAPREHLHMYASATEVYIDLFPFYVFLQDKLFQWRPEAGPLDYHTESGKSIVLDVPTIHAAILDYHELFLMTSAAQRLFGNGSDVLQTQKLEALEALCSRFRSGDHAGAIEALTDYRFMQYKRKPKPHEGTNLTLDFIEAVCLLNLEKRNEAETVLNRLIRMVPRLCYPYQTLIKIKEDSGRTGESVRLSKRLDEIVISQDQSERMKPAREHQQRFRAFESADLLPELIDLKRRVSLHSAVVIGREREITEAIEILCCMNQNNAMIVGQPGTGKTVLVQEVVRRLAADDLPVQLKQAPAYELNVASLFSGIAHAGQLEQKLAHILSLVSREGAILFIDDVHTMLNESISRSSTVDISTMLKSVIEGNGGRFIATTTYDAYATKISSIPLFSRFFQRIDLAELPMEDIAHIMHIRADDFSQYHRVTIDIDGICKHLDTVRQFFRDRMLPDKAIALLDRACSRKSMERQEQEAILPHVTEMDFLTVVADARGVEISTISASLQERLKVLESAVNRQIIGQPEVVAKLARKIVPSRTGLKMKEGRPDGVFLFVGPTGVGKTETARVLTEVLLGSEDKLLRIDMSEYMEEYSVSRLIGAAPGYVGYEDQNQLIDEIRRDPYRIVLLDEIEKAHPVLINIFLQVFDSGILTDSKGKKAYFDKCIIIMTSNVGVSLFSEAHIGFDPDQIARTVTRSDHSKELKRFFRPEFLNRIDEVIFFNALTLENARSIVELHVNRLNERFKKKGLRIRLSEAAVEFVAEKGFSEEYGAREILRVIQDRILQPIAELRLKSATAFRNVSVAYRKGSDKLVFRTSD